ncbi:hypothetical protein MRB53_004355 [Persea americana]|uniref:Uncharacterized protein n=1 Tax=Persea americana TaxID=3435 RepID=A0ACC2MAC7_PERAE|nr:hypothetical protein MRB53_004355 [Persea americana]
MKTTEWSELHIELLGLIVRQLDPVQFYRFCATCKSWRAAAMFKCYPLSHRVPWLVLSKHDDKTHAHSFFSLSHQTDYWLELPELRRKRCCGSSYGWLITIEYETFDLHLLNPFSRRQIKLPSPKTFPRPYDKELPYLKVHYIQKAILSKDPSSTDDYTVLVIFSGMCRLAFFRPRKEGKWIVMDYRPVLFQNVIYYREQFYAIDMLGALVLVGLDPQPKLTKITPYLKRHASTCKRYLVEWSGELLHVRRPMAFDDEPYDDSSDRDNDDWNWDGPIKGYKDKFLFPDADKDKDEDNDDIFEEGDIPEDLKLFYKTGIFKVYKLVHLSNCEYRWKKMESLDDCVLFLGDNAPLSLPVANFSEFKGNRIYFTDDYWEAFNLHHEQGCHDLGIFNLEDKTIESFYPNDYHSPKLPPIWIAPNP